LCVLWKTPTEADSVGVFVFQRMNQVRVAAGGLGQSPGAGAGAELGLSFVAFPTAFSCASFTLVGGSVLLLPSGGGASATPVMICFLSLKVGTNQSHIL
jgi:hypothetical protein